MEAHLTSTMTLISGQVLDPHGQPAADASVYFISTPVAMPDIALLADDQGRFTLAAPAPGRYVLGVRSETWGAAQKGFEVTGEETLTIEVRIASTEG